MAKKRKAPSSQQAHEQKPKSLREHIVEEVEEEEEETSDEEEEVEVEESEEESSDEEEESSSDEDEEEESSSDEEEPDDDASKRETLRELLDPFAKSQIIDLLKQAAANEPKILPKIVQVADSDPTHRKIFVHGLGWDATSDQLLEAFRPFGEIEDSKLVTDKNTGRAKGYAFVLFKTRATAKKALKVPQKRIGSRMVSCQLAALGPPTGTGAAASADGGGSRKMYVGNVGAHVSPEKLKAFFERFGEIEEGPLGMDPITNKFKGFAVFTYRSQEGYKKAMEEPIKVFENCQLHCKKFVENQNKNNASGQSGGGAGGTSPAVADVSYGGLGANTGMLGGNLSGSGLLMSQNAGIGLAGNPMLAAGYNPVGLTVSGLSTPIAGMSGTYGMMGNYGSQAALQGLGAFQNAQTGQSSVGTAGAPTMGNYGSQAALHGLGAYQNTQTGQSSIGTAGTTTTAIRGPTSGVSVPKKFSSYFSR